LTRLIEVDDNDFAWMIDARPSTRNGLSLPPDGVESANILQYLRAMVQRLHASDCRSAWMIVAEETVVGLCSFKAPPDAAGAVEIGYGLNAHFRRRGHATRAIAQLVRAACDDQNVKLLKAEIAVDNIASRRVVEANGFVRRGTRLDAEDGELVLWERSVDG